MLGLIKTEVIEMVPYAIALCGICFLLLIICLITRALTIRHMRLHLPELAKKEIAEKNKLIERLQEENYRYRAENNDWYVKIKTIKSVTDKVMI